MAQGIALKVDQLISANKVMIFSKSYCPFCSEVKRLFDKMGITFYCLELDLEEDGDDIQNVLLKKSGQRTVPNVFVNGTHVGGCDDTKRANADGKLQELLLLEK